MAGWVFGQRHWIKLIWLEGRGMWRSLHMMETDVQEHFGQCPYVARLRNYAQQKDLQSGCRLHSELERMGLLDNDLFICSALINMYSNCGSFSRAQEVFDNCAVKNVVLWNTLITGCVKHGEGEQVLNLFDRMKQELMPPDAVTYVCALKACGSIGAIRKGQDIHMEIASKALDVRDVFVGSALIDMYAKCGLLGKAQEVFNNLAVRNIVSWNALITGYAQHGDGKVALAYFELMQSDQISPDAITFVCILKACGSIGAVEKGCEIHHRIVREDLLRKDVFLVCAVVDMYCRFGMVTQAQEAFNDLPFRNVASWNALITGYNEHGHSKHAVACYEQMQVEGVLSNAVTCICILKSFASIQSMDKGCFIHVQILEKRFLENNLSVAGSLVDMYCKCGSAARAQKVFNSLRVRNVVLWNALITGYVQHDYGEEALGCFVQMQLEGVFPDVITFVCILKACGSLGAVQKGQIIHTEIVRQGLLQTDVPVGNVLVDMYTKCSLLANAQEVFERMPARDTISWNGLIGGYALNGQYVEALKCFERMQEDEISPDATTFVCVLRGCASIRAVGQGRELHSKIRREGWLTKDVFIGNALIDMYIKCELLLEAQEVFDELPIRDDYSWGALIAGYVQHQCAEEALNCFGRMQLSGVSPSANTLMFILKACGSIQAPNVGEYVHGELMGKGLLEENSSVGNAVIDMYAKCGLLVKAEEVFGSLPVRDCVSWNVLLSAYAQHGHYEEALNCFGLMQLQGFSPKAVTFVCVLKACGNLGAINKGQEIHAKIIKKGLLRKNIILGNALINMYVKCGAIARAHGVFDKLVVRDLVSWNVIISGYSQFGHAQNVFDLLKQMISACMKPEVITFVGVLNACSHAGLVDEGLLYFETMNRDYYILPGREHYACMVDLLARAGQSDRMVAVIKQMPAHTTVVMLHTIIRACQKWGDVDLGRQAFDYAVKLDTWDHASYVSMSNLHSDTDVQEDMNQNLASGREKLQSDSIFSI